jgi:hypothetical protein
MKHLLTIAACAFLISCTDAGEGSADSERDTTDVTRNNAASQEMKEERNKATAMRSINGFVNRKADSVLFAIDSVSFTEYGDGSMPPMRYNDSVKIGLQSWMDAFPDMKGSDFITVADDDYVIVYGTWTGTWKNDYMGMKATGKTFNVRDADIFKFNEDGKMIEHRGVQSGATLANQIGMKMQ